MKRVLKYKLDWHNDALVEVYGIPGIICSVAVQNDTPHVWIEVAEAYQWHDATFLIYATGRTIPNNLIFVATIHYAPTQTVWHVYQTPFRKLK